MSYDVVAHAATYWEHFAFTSEDSLRELLNSGSEAISRIWGAYPPKDFNPKQRCLIVFCIANRLSLIEQLIDYLEEIERYLACN